MAVLSRENGITHLFECQGVYQTDSKCSHTYVYALLSNRLDALPLDVIYYF